MALEREEEKRIFSLEITKISGQVYNILYLYTSLVLYTCLEILVISNSFSCFASEFRVTC